MSKDLTWDKGSQEEAVSKFYAYGVENFGDFHGGYLNFGYWEEGNKDYLIAAERLIHKLGDLLKLDRDSALLDVACGMGGQDVYLARNFPLKSIVAFDLMAEHLSHAKRRIDHADLAGIIKTKQGTATNLTFNDSTFSHILCVEGIVHFNTRFDFFRECHRVLKPGGRVVFSDYALKKTPKNAFDRWLLKTVTNLWHIPVVNIDSPEVYQERLEQVGFQNVKIHCVGENVVPGYCKEQARSECINELSRIRGFFAGRIGHIIDIVLDWAYRFGLVEYIFVEGEKPE
jgi:ubiquinone/menaquinone biosynthesis C-methylase UbiE